MRLPSATTLAVLGALWLAGCGGTPPGAPAPASGRSSPDQVVQSFMRAVADSNVAGMAQFWGTARGSAASTGQPADWEKRLTVTQLYLRRAPFKIVGGGSTSNDQGRREVQVQLDRGACQRVVPFVVILTSSEGWLVNQIDLNAAGTPDRPCDTPRPSP